MKPDYLQTTEEVLSSQGSSSWGLTGEEAAARLSKHGPNRLQEAKKITNFQRSLPREPYGGVHHPGGGASQRRIGRGAGEQG